MQAEFSPFPNYRFDGENLSHDPATQIHIEQGYYSRSDAAVVFALERDGRRRYIYHGNDGTGLPWNDTAQLDHTRADVRQAIIETALSLSRYFSVIRFDAAMTLTRDHYRRLSAGRGARLHRCRPCDLDDGCGPAGRGAA
jgi:hypothetical protein